METNNSNTNLNQDERFPNLEKARRKNLFTVPEGYFNQLPGAIADQINAGKQPVTYGRNYKPVVLGLSLIVAIALILELIISEPLKIKKLASLLFPIRISISPDWKMRLYMMKLPLKI
ncbi:MAG: hypothetical protein IPN13_21575 [Bacteroidetes bacterium]|nr:hypothetical protein [Bacteroidota bacterium]